MNYIPLGPMCGAKLCRRSSLPSQTSRVGFMFIQVYNYESIGIFCYLVFL